MGYNNFKDDLALANGIEERVMLTLMGYNKDLEFHGFSSTKGYDAHFSIKGKYYKIEIKSDYHTNKTGNIVIEYSSRGKPSGIITTTAHLLAYSAVTPNGLVIYMFKVLDVRDLVKRKKYKREIIGGDYGSNTKMYIFNLYDIREYYTIIKEKQ